jgi:hypothetical protein
MVGGCRLNLTQMHFIEGILRNIDMKTCSVLEMSDFNKTLIKLGKNVTELKIQERIMKFGEKT